MGSESKKMVSICFDDGNKTNYTIALPKLKECGFKATFAITTSFAEKINSGCMTWKEVEELKAKGMDIVSHGVNHIDFRPETDKIVFHEELVNSKEMLAKHGITTEIFVYPFGNCAADPIVQSEVKEHYRWARGAIRSLYPSRYNLNAQGMFWFNYSDFFAALDRPEKLTIIYYHAMQEKPEGYNIFTEQFEEQMDYLKKYRYNIVTLKEALSMPEIIAMY